MQISFCKMRNHFTQKERVVGWARNSSNKGRMEGREVFKEETMFKKKSNTIM